MIAMAAPPSFLARLLRLSGSNRLMLAEALVSLSSASLAINLLPFRRTVEAMKVRLRDVEPESEEQQRLIAQCRWAVLAWADRVPWRAVCFQRGLALHLMLRRRGIRSILHYGVAQSEKHGLRAHVWIDVGDQTVLGGEEAPHFTCLASFPAAERG
jgi:hypothetical protein